jgi:hypothetical protein
MAIYEKKNANAMNAVKSGSGATASGGGKSTKKTTSKTPGSAAGKATSTAAWNTQKTTKAKQKTKGAVSTVGSIAKGLANAALGVTVYPGIAKRVAGSLAKKNAVGLTGRQVATGKDALKSASTGKKPTAKAPTRNAYKKKYN